MGKQNQKRMQIYSKQHIKPILPIILLNIGSLLKTSFCLLRFFQLKFDKEPSANKRSITVSTTGFKDRSTGSAWHRYCTFKKRKKILLHYLLPSDKYCILNSILLTSSIDHLSSARLLLNLFISADFLRGIQLHNCPCSLDLKDTM